MNRVIAVLPNGFTVYPISGAEGRGYSTEGDIVPTLIDGTPTSTMWDELQQTLHLLNDSRDSFTALVTRRTNRAADAIVQAGYDSDQFEEASEFGIPQALAATGTPEWLGVPFRDYDLATRFTHRFLRDATAEQVESIHNRALAADNKLVNNAIMRRLFDPTPDVNADGRTVYGPYSGDSMVPQRVPRGRPMRRTPGSGDPPGAGVGRRATARVRPRRPRDLHRQARPRTASRLRAQAPEASLT